MPSIALHVLAAEQQSNLHEYQQEWSRLFASIFGLVVAVGILLWIYRSMQAPRLYLVVDQATGEPKTTWQSIVRYLVLTPIVMGIWFYAILTILLFATANRAGDSLVIAAAVVVGSSRVLAHISPEASHELGKTVPLAVLSIILISGIASNENQLTHIAEEFDKNVDVLDSYYWGLVMLDVVITAVWYFAVRSRWKGHKLQSSRTRWRAAFKPISNGWRAVISFGKPQKPHTPGILDAVPPPPGGHGG